MNRRPVTAIDLAALSKLAPELAETFVTLASDIALVIDSRGVIDKVALGNGGSAAPGAGDWVGRPWADTVTGDTRAKVEELLREASTSGTSHRREINHLSPAGVDIPFSYAAVRLGAHGPVLAVGRDLRAISGIQQQFVEAQQEIEREYWKHRQAETRYRVLFQVATDAVLIVDAETMRIIDGNQAASELFDIAPDRLIGMEAISTIDRVSRPAVSELLANARAMGMSAEIRAWLSGRRVSARISATPFRSADAMLLLLRVRAVDSGEDAADASRTLIQLVERTPDSVVVVDTGGRILMANRAFVELAQFDDERNARGRPLADVFGAQFGDVIATARNRGIAVSRAAPLQGLRGRTALVDVSAALLADEDQECVGLTIRVREPDATFDARHRRKVGDLATAIDALTVHLGRLGLPELLAKVKEQAELYFLQSTLQITGGDKSEAAKILGLSADQLDARLRGVTTPPGSGQDAGLRGTG